MIHETQWEGIWNAPQIGNLDYEIVGNLIFLTFPKIILAASQQNNIVNTVPLPEFIRPLQIRSSQFRIQNGGGTKDAWGLVTINSNGQIIIGADANNIAFNGEYNSGFHSQTIVYAL